MKRYNSQICTTREQSERLLALGLRRETADMYLSYDIICAKPYYKVEEFMKGCVPEDIFPAWSLARLVELMPCDVEISGIWIYANRSYEFKEKNNVYDNLIDLLTSIIKEGYFNKEYLCEK